MTLDHRHIPMKYTSWRVLRLKGGRWMETQPLARKEGETAGD